MKKYSGLKLLVHQFINKIWYSSNFIKFILWPCSLIYLAIIKIRRFYLVRYKQKKFPIPIIIVGNLTVGGAGKTPLVIAITQKLQQQGWQVGIISRGYKSKLNAKPYLIKLSDLADMVGDEPLLIAKVTKCPVVIAKNRTQAVQYLLSRTKSQIIISDDGLQHYKLGRDIEIAVIDGSRYFGNKLCLPAGPLREPLSRLKQCDLLIVNNGNWPNAYKMQLLPEKIINIATGIFKNCQDFSSPVAAVTGIGNPQRFFDTLAKMDINYKPYAFPDHYFWRPQELIFPESELIMTAKDAIRCQHFAHDSWYYLNINVQLHENFWQQLLKLITHANLIPINENI